jgi:MarR family transcriptional regulator, lower aerobic nicotinate degradation pathway regulator
MTHGSETASAATGAPARPAPSTQISPVDALAQLSFVVMDQLERRAAEHDLSLAATRLLGVLRDREPTMNELARLLELDKSSVTGLVDRAERRGLVARVPSAADRRSVLVRLTAAGQAQVSAAAEGFATDVTAMLDALPLRDRATLTRLISRVLVTRAAHHGIDLLAPPDQQVRLSRCRREARLAERLARSIRWPHDLEPRNVIATDSTRPRRQPCRHPYRAQPDDPDAAPGRMEANRSELCCNRPCGFSFLTSCPTSRTR